MMILKALSLGEGWERLSSVGEYKTAGRYEVEFIINSDEGRNLPAGWQGRDAFLKIKRE